MTRNSNSREIETAPTPFLATMPATVRAQRAADWLVRRGWLDSKWLPQVRALRCRVEEARARLSPELREQLGGREGYDAAEMASRAIEQREHDSGRSVRLYLGVFAPAELRAWRAIESKYRKNNLHLAELAWQLSALVGAAVPQARQRAIEAAQKVVLLSQRASGSAAAVRESEAALEAARVHMGVRDGETLDRAFERSRADLPAALAHVAALAARSHVVASAQLYIDFASFQATFDSATKGSPVGGQAPMTNYSRVVAARRGTGSDGKGITSPNSEGKSRQAGDLALTDSTTPTRHVLLNETLRTAFVNDLSELLAFLEGRIAESARSEDPVAPDEYEKRSPGLAPRLFSSTLSTAASAVREALNAACAPDLERSLRAASEPRFRARAAMAMEAHQQSISRAQTAVVDAKARLLSARSAAARARGEAERLEGEAYRLKRALETGLRALVVERMGSGKGLDAIEVDLGFGRG